MTSALSAFNSFLYPQGSMFGTRNYDVYQKDDEVIISIDLPGLSDKDIDVTVEGTSLIIEAKKETERRKTSYRKQFNIDGFDKKAIKAEMSNGVLEISLKQPASSKPTKVKVLAA